MNYLLDTNVISELISKKPNQNVLSFIQNLDENNIYLSVITIGEIKSGIENIKDEAKKEKLSSWLYDDLLERFKNKIIDINIDVMLEWGKTNQNLKSIGKSLPIMDSLIGATCIVKGFALVTRNDKDFKNLDIKIVNPFLNN